MHSDSPIRVGSAVAAALASGGPIVALESTIICHGMPYPANHTTAVALEAAVRAAGAVPATVALLGGVPVVGVDARGLAHLAVTGASVRKVGRRGLAAAVAAGVDGATTVSATAAVAAAVGVRVFATGGLGGVHRGVAATWDISEDVAALGAVRVAVVCAGIKSLVDVAKSLEALESAGVGVYTLLTEPDNGGDVSGGGSAGGGKPPRPVPPFPAFYTRDSGVPSPAVLPSIDAAAALLVAADTLPTSPAGEVLAVPIPAAAAADGATVGAAIDTALAEAAADRLTGPAVTPFLLRRVAELSGGASLAANVALAKNNAAVAGRLAVAYAAARRRAGRWEGRRAPDVPWTAPLPLPPVENVPAGDVTGETATNAAARGGGRGIGDDEASGMPATPRLVVIGAIASDIHAAAGGTGGATSGTSNPGVIHPPAMGGVAYNIALAAVRTGLLDRHELLLVSPTAGADTNAREAGTPTDRGGDGGGGGSNNGGSGTVCPPPSLVAHLAAVGLSAAGLVPVPGGRPPTYLAVHDGASGELLVGVADMALPAAPWLARAPPGVSAALASATVVVIDANVGAADVAAVVAAVNPAATVWVEPVSVAKAARLAALPPSVLGRVDWMSPNKPELRSLAAALADDGGGVGDGVSDDDGGGAIPFPVPAAAAAASDQDAAADDAAAATLLRTGIRNVLLTRGADGVVWYRSADDDGGDGGDGGGSGGSGRGDGHRVVRTALPAMAAAKVVSTTGAGDTLVGVAAAAVAAATVGAGGTAARAGGCAGALDGLAGEARVVAALRLGMAAAAESVAVISAVAGTARLDWRRLRTAASLRGRL
ncbi:hypothetical protein MMPV_001365 [Pyropia vietnamensis]